MRIDERREVLVVCMVIYIDISNPITNRDDFAANRLGHMPAAL